MKISVFFLLLSLARNVCTALVVTRRRIFYFEMKMLFSHFDLKQKCSLPLLFSIDKQAKGHNVIITDNGFQQSVGHGYHC